jgi:hypothetical protein
MMLRANLVVTVGETTSPAHSAASHVMTIPGVAPYPFSTALVLKVWQPRDDGTDIFPGAMVQ